MCFTQWAIWDCSATHFLLLIIVAYSGKDLPVVSAVLGLTNDYVHFSSTLDSFLLVTFLKNYNAV